MVICSAIMDKMTVWRVKGPYGTDSESLSGKIVKSGAKIRLEHIETHRNLHTHSHRPAPLSRDQQEVTCYRIGEDGDENDDWIVVASSSEWVTGESFRLRSATTKYLLHSHLGRVSWELTCGEYEATTANVNDANDEWKCEESDQPAQAIEEFSLLEYTSKNWLTILSIAGSLASITGWTAISLIPFGTSLLTISITALILFLGFSLVAGTFSIGHHFLLRSPLFRSWWKFAFWTFGIVVTIALVLLTIHWVAPAVSQFVTWCLASNAPAQPSKP
jgi:dolichyl-phosphate-mannose--protein O-mannosyl transferase